MAAPLISQDDEMEPSMYPIAALLDELKHEDLQLRLNATRRIKIIAEALGPERTRGELLPFLTDTIDDEDDILLALAEELGDFVDEIGGAAYASVLVQPLETLSTVEESLVREKAVEALCNLSSHVAKFATDDSRIIHVEHLLPLLQRLATGDWFTSRISACALVAHVYQHLPAQRAELRAEVLSVYKGLAHDETPMVRRSAASNLAAVAKAVSLSSPHLIGTELLEIFSKLVEDDQDSVRLLVVENSAVFASLLTNCSATGATGNGGGAGGKDAVQQASGGGGGGGGDTAMKTGNTAMKTGNGSESSGVDGNMPDGGAEECVSSGDMRDVDSSDVTTANSDCRDDSGKPDDGPPNGHERVVAYVRGFATDKSWRVRYMVADQLAELCDALGATATRTHILPAYISVLKDTEPEVRTAAAFKVTEVIKRVVALREHDDDNSGLDYIVQEIVPIVEQLVGDSAQHVRSALASNIIGLAPVLGTEVTLKHVVDVVLALLKDDCPEVRLNVIARLDKVSFIMSIEKLSRELLPAIVDLAEDKNWRVRLAIIDRIALLGRQLGKKFFEENGKLGELCIHWLEDSVYSIREAAITNLKNLTEVFGVEWAKAHIVKQVLDMYEKSSNYLLRMTALHAIGVLSQVVGVDIVEETFLPIVTERAARDPVPNVRFCCAKTLNVVIPFVSNDVREAKIRPCLMSLIDGNEKDTDVNYFAQQALIKMASSSSSSSSPCPS